jgi:hypothetical protein
MPARFRLVTATLFVVSLFSTVPACSQSEASAAPGDTILHAAETAKLLPASVFFAGQSAPVQLRNSGGIKFQDGKLLLAVLVDTSGYSTAVQQKYQSYFITEVSIEIGGHALPAGAYGVGFVQGHFGVMDIGDHDLFTVDATKDAELKRPTPLQFIADNTPNQYRLYQGREYVVISRAAK